MKYHKIQTIFKRCMDSGPNKNKLIYGDWTCDEFRSLENTQWDASEKIDGTNIRIDWNGEKLSFGGRTDNALIPATLVNLLMGLLTAEKFTKLGLQPMTIFGEGFGVGIQKGDDYIHGKNSVEFAVFDIFCGGSWLVPKDVAELADKLNAEHAPIVGKMTLTDAIYMVKNGFDSVFGSKAAEGLVLRAPEGLLDRRGNRIICKIKTKDFSCGVLDVD